MNIPLSWLSEYVTLPKNSSELTNMFTMIGHMLDKSFEIDGETVIDLELRGNRADLYGLIGIAREVSAFYTTPLRLPENTPLPKKTDHSLVTVESPQLVDRFTALTLSVKVEKSPEWIIQRLSAYGIPSINNVVDITNYVMIETGEPMHAYDTDKLDGKRLIVRTAKKGETLQTLQGTVVQLTADDLVIADQKHPQGLTMIGGQHAAVSEQTTSILLEAAVYNQAHVRKTARRLGIRTEAGNRHEKNLDPHGVEFALMRAVFLLKQYAHAQTTSMTADFFPHPPQKTRIQYNTNETKRLTGLDIPTTDQIDILTRLDFEVQKEAHSDKHKTSSLIGDVVQITVPTYRSDILESADIVEEIARMTGYDKIPTTTLSEPIPLEQTQRSIILEQKLKSLLVQLQLNEIITSSFIANDTVSLYEKNGTFPPIISLQNPPDQSSAYLRPTLLVNMAYYAKRSLLFKNKRVALFEIGNIYTKNTTENTFDESKRLGILLTGTTSMMSYGGQSRAITYADIKGVLESLVQELGISCSYTRTAQFHPSLEPQSQGICRVNDTDIGLFGVVHKDIQTILDIPHPLYYAEIMLDLLTLPPTGQVKPYEIAPQFPPAFEDISFTVGKETEIGTIIDSLKTVHPLIVDVRLNDVFENNRTFRITYSSPEKTLTSSEIKEARETLLSHLNKTFNIQINE